MKFGFALLCAFFAVCALSCRSREVYLGNAPKFEIGGGGSIHHPPDYLVRGQPANMALELSVWGEGTGTIRERYKNVSIHYKTDRQNDYVAMLMTIDKVETNTLTYKCIIPPQATLDGDTFHYYFDELFDGHYGRRDEEPVPILDGIQESPDKGSGH
jgi:hypothetical protein